MAGAPANRKRAAVELTLRSAPDTLRGGRFVLWDNLPIKVLAVFLRSPSCWGLSKGVLLSGLVKGCPRVQPALKPSLLLPTTPCSSLGLLSHHQFCRRLWRGGKKKKKRARNLCGASPTLQNLDVSPRPFLTILAFSRLPKNSEVVVG